MRQNPKIYTHLLSGINHMVDVHNRTNMEHTWNIHGTYTHRRYVPSMSHRCLINISSTSQQHLSNVSAMSQQYLSDVSAMSHRRPSSLPRGFTLCRGGLAWGSEPASARVHSLVSSSQSSLSRQPKIHPRFPRFGSTSLPEGVRLFPPAASLFADAVSHGAASPVHSLPS